MWALGVVAADLGRLLERDGPAADRQERPHRRAAPTAASRSRASAARPACRVVNAGGRKLPELVAKFGLEHGLARLDSWPGPLFGGQIDGHGTVQLWEKRASKPLKSPIVDVKLDARDIDLATLARSD